MPPTIECISAAAADVVNCVSRGRGVAHSATSDHRPCLHRPGCAHSAPDRLSVAQSASRSRSSASFSTCATTLALFRAAASAGVSSSSHSCLGAGSSGRLRTDPAPKRTCWARSLHPPPSTMARSPPRSTHRASERHAIDRTGEAAASASLWLANGGGGGGGGRLPSSQSARSAVAASSADVSSTMASLSSRHKAVSRWLIGRIGTPWGVRSAAISASNSGTPIASAGSRSSESRSIGIRQPMAHDRRPSWCGGADRGQRARRVCPLGREPPEGDAGPLCRGERRLAQRRCQPASRGRERLHTRRRLGMGLAARLVPGALAHSLAHHAQQHGTQLLDRANLAQRAGRACASLQPHQGRAGDLAAARECQRAADRLELRARDQHRARRELAPGGRRCHDGERGRTEMRVHHRRVAAQWRAAALLVHHVAQRQQARQPVGARDALGAVDGQVRERCGRALGQPAHRRERPHGAQAPLEVIEQRHRRRYEEGEHRLLVVHALEPAPCRRHAHGSAAHAGHLRNVGFRPPALPRRLGAGFRLGRRRQIEGSTAGRDSLLDDAEAAFAGEPAAQPHLNADGRALSLRPRQHPFQPRLLPLGVPLGLGDLRGDEPQVGRRQIQQTCHAERRDAQLRGVAGPLLPPGARRRPGPLLLVSHRRRWNQLRQKQHGTRRRRQPPADRLQRSCHAPERAEQAAEQERLALGPAGADPAPRQKRNRGGAQPHRERRQLVEHIGVPIVGE
eukprot:scaffold1415_cov117-Isochrysis_galbana.AAC.14